MPPPPLPPMPTTAGSAGRRMPWPTPDTVGRLGWWLRSLGPGHSLTPSSGLCRAGSDWLTPMGPHLSRPLEGRGDPRVHGPPPGWRESCTGTRRAHAPGGWPGRRSTHYSLALLCPGWSLQHQLEVIQVSQGAPLWGTPCDYQYPGGFLWGTAWRQLRVPRWPSGACRGSTPLWLADGAMREGNQQERGTKPILTGTHLPPSICRHAPLPSGRERQNLLQGTVTYDVQSRAFLRGGPQLDSVCLHGRHKRPVCGTSQYCLSLLFTHGGRASVSSWRLSVYKHSTPGPTPIVIHLHKRVRKIEIQMLS